MKPRAISLDGSLLPPDLVGVMVLLDRSGSMAAVKKPMESAYAEFLTAQRALNPAGMWVSLYQFDSKDPNWAAQLGSTETLSFEACYERSPLAEAAPLVITPRGGTPLRDALFRFATLAQAIVDDAADPTQRLLLVVVSDGEENTSRDHGWPEVKALLDGLKSDACELIYLGTSESVVGAVAHAGVAAGSTLSWQPDSAGVAYASHGLTYATTMMRSSGVSASASLANYVGQSAAVSDEVLAAAVAKAVKGGAVTAVTTTEKP